MSICRFQSPRGGDVSEKQEVILSSSRRALISIVGLINAIVLVACAMVVAIAFQAIMLLGKHRSTHAPPTAS